MNKILKEDRNTFLKRILFFVIGEAFIALGVALTIVSEVGAGAWDALSVGLSNIFGLTVGTWVVLVAVFLIILSAVLMKRRPRWTTLVTSFLTGSGIDLFLNVLSGVKPSGFLSGLFIFLLGVITISLGAAIYIYTELPPGPIDYFAIVIKERFNLSIGWGKTIEEAVGFILGILFHGPIGIGSIIIMAIEGPLIQAISKVTDPLLKKMIYGGRKNCKAA